MTGDRLFDPDSVGSSDGQRRRGTDASRRGDHHLDDARPAGSVVRVRPDVSGIDKEFDYLVPATLAERIEVGSIVRVELNRRSVAAWVTAVGPEPPEGVELRPITKVSSVGPSAELVELARWAAHRWSGNVATLLKTASPPRMVHSLPTAPAAPEGRGSPRPASPTSIDDARPSASTTPIDDARPSASTTPIDDARPSASTTPIDDALPSGGGPALGPSVLRVPPNEDLAPLVASLVAPEGSTLVIAPRLGQAGALAGRLRRGGLLTRLHPRDWPAAAGRGGVVLGARSAVWARVPDLRSVVVLDEHDEALQEERNPTWHARDVAIERAARVGAACHLISPIPSPAALVAAPAPPTTPSRATERASWPAIEVVDRRAEEPGRSGLFSRRVADVVRGEGTVLAVLNRKGRAIMLACALCGELARTEDGERLMAERDGRLVAPGTGEERPVVCASCGSTKLKRLRLGVSRAAEELAALAGESVDEITAGRPAGASDARDQRSPRSRVVVGTEAALHQLGRVETVVFLDFDQELMASRYRAAEQALALLVLAARLTGGRTDGGRVIIQTRTPDHRVVRAAVLADPARFAEEELALRRSMGWPPFSALAEISGQAAASFAEPLRSRATVEPLRSRATVEALRSRATVEALRSRATVEVLGPRDDGRYLLRAPDPDTLADVLAAADRPSGRFRVAVDPPRA